RASEIALTDRLWRQDRAEWNSVREELRSRLLRFSEIDPSRMVCESLLTHISHLREIFVEGTFRHFVQQPSSMFPVGDWVRNACTWTGCAPASALSLLRGSPAGSSDFD